MTHEQEQLILNNLDYAKALHHKFCNEHEISDRDDYLQQANLGLVEASLKYKKVVQSSLPLLITAWKIICHAF